MCHTAKCSLATKTKTEGPPWPTPLFLMGSHGCGHGRIHGPGHGTRPGVWEAGTRTGQGWDTGGMRCTVDEAGGGHGHGHRQGQWHDMGRDSGTTGMNMGTNTG